MSRQQPLRLGLWAAFNLISGPFFVAREASDMGKISKTITWR
jgi:hypothetical protein